VYVYSGDGDKCRHHLSSALFFDEGVGARRHPAVGHMKRLWTATELAE